MSEKKTNEKGKAQDNSTEKCGLSIENFINDAYSICREERPYALFLYNILRYYRIPERREGKVDVQKIFTVCGLDEKVAVVDYVFYEATFMRDFFERNRRLRYSSEEDWKLKLLNKKFTAANENSEIESFNKKLIQFVYEEMCEEHGIKASEIEIESLEMESNLGQNEKEFEKIKIVIEGLDESDKEWIKYRVKWMMNARPDIAVVYHIGEENAQKFLLFIECKFLSKESSYPYYCENRKVENVKQRRVQWMIAKFLCNYLNKNNRNEMELSPSMEEDKSRLVKFVRKDVKEGEILIERLIKLNDEIFKEE